MVIPKRPHWYKSIIYKKLPLNLPNVSRGRKEDFLKCIAGR